MVRDVKVIVCVELDCGFKAGVLPQEVPGIDTAPPRSKSHWKNSGAHVVEREAVTGMTVRLDFGPPIRAGNDVHVHAGSGQGRRKMPSEAGFAPPIRRNFVGGNKHLRRTVAPDSCPLTVWGQTIALNMRGA